MEKEEFTAIVDRLKEVSGENSDRKLSLWLGRPVNYLSLCRMRNSIDFEAIISKCGDDPVKLSYVLTGKKGEIEKIEENYYQIPIMAQIGAGEVYEAEIPQEDSKFITLYRRPLKGEVAVVVKGDSMETTLYDGDVVTCVPTILGSMQNGQDYVVVTENGPQIKQVFWEMGTMRLRLRSRNPKYKEDIFPQKVYRCFEIIDHVHKYRVPTERDPDMVEEEVVESKELLKKRKKIYPGDKGHK
jgi:SOS-response transcriptional repressor LexA